jgi:hypothetical protein
MISMVAKLRKLAIRAAHPNADAFRLVILALLASAGGLAYEFSQYFDFETEQVPTWLSLKEKPHPPSAICAAAMIR